MCKGPKLNSNAQSRLCRILGVTALYLVAMASVAAAQISEDWEAGLGTWSVTGGLWETGFPSPTIGPAPHSGSRCVGTVIASEYPDRADTRLVSPAFTVPPAAEEPRLRFWHWFDITSDGAGADGGRMQIRRTSTGVWENLPLEEGTEIDGSSFGGTGLTARWALVSIDLRAYAGSQVEVAFWFTSNTTGANRAGWYIDDVAVVTGRAPSLAQTATTWDANDDVPLGWHTPRGLWEVGRPTLESQEPTGTVSGQRCVGTILGDVYPDGANALLISPIFTVPEANARPRLEFSHWYEVTADGSGADGGRVQIRRIGGAWEPLPLEDRGEFEGSSNGGTGLSARWARASIDLTAYAGADVEVSFRFTSNTTGTNQAGWYIDDVRVATEAPPSPAVAVVDWDAADTLPEGWHAPSGVWEVGAPTQQSSEPTRTHSGSRCVGTMLGRNYEDRANARLISPVFRVPPTGESPRLRFWHWYAITADGGSIGADGGRVQIRRRGGIWETLSIDSGVLEFEGSSNAGSGSSTRWAPVSMDLSSYGGDEVEISFLFTSNTTGTNLGGWYIDDVGVVSGDFVSHNPETWDTVADHPGDWSSPFGTWEVGVPAVSVGTVSGPNCVGTRLGTNYPQSATPILISPRMGVPAEQPMLRVRSWHSLDAGDNCALRIRRPGDIGWTPLRTLLGSSSGWQIIEVPLGDYSGEVVEFAFLLNSNSTGNQGLGWYLDNLEVLSTIDTDCPTVSIDPVPSTVFGTKTPTLDLTFSEEVNNVESSVRVTLNGANLLSTTTSTGSQTYRVSVLNGLSSGDTFQVEIPSTIVDAAGNALDGNGDGTCGDGLLVSYSIEPEAGDTTPPTVVEVSPAPSALGVDASASLVVRFSEPVTNVQPGWTVRGSSSGVIAGTVSDAAATVWTFDASADFAGGETVTCTLASTIADGSGNHLDGNGDGTGGDGFTWTFRVAEGGDLGPVEDPSTGHFYQVIAASVTWPVARAEAEALTYEGRRGHLVAINSAAENRFLSDTFGAGSLHMHWIGGFQQVGASEPMGGWSWVTDEAFSYQNWGSGEPNNLTPNENALAFDHSTSAAGKQWNDLQGTRTLSGYVVEFGRSLPSCASASVAYSDPFPARRYFLLSVPMGFVDAPRLDDVLDDLGSMGNDRWQGYGVRASSVVRNPIVSTGAAYWIATSGDTPPPTVNGCALAGPVQVELDAPGWYAVGVPVLESARGWSTVDVTSGGSTNAFGLSDAVAPNVWWWDDLTDDLVNDGEYRNGNATTPWNANPWGGYLVYVNEACELEFSTTARHDDLARQAATPVLPEPEWGITLRMDADGRSGGTVRVGAREGSSVGFDRGDVLKPPFVGDGARLAILQRDYGWPEFMEAFVPIEEVLEAPRCEWELRCTSPEDGGYARLDGSLDSVPAHLNVYLRDEQGAVVADLRQEQSYEFIADEPRTFTLLVTPEDLGFQPPTTRWLQVGPNPASGSVNIAFEAARSGQVSLRIFDVTGRIVEVLADERLDRGTHVRTWNAGSSEVPAGVYFARIDSRSDALTRKITVLK